LHWAHLGHMHMVGVYLVGMYLRVPNKLVHLDCQSSWSVKFLRPQNFAVAFDWLKRTCLTSLIDCEAGSEVKGGFACGKCYSACEVLECIRKWLLEGALAVGGDEGQKQCPSLASLEPGPDGWARACLPNADHRYASHWTCIS
jgi:hypothetical protein